MSGSQPLMDPNGDERRRPSASLATSLSYFVPSYLLAIAGYMASTVVAARMLGAADFGYYMVLLTATTLIGQVSLLGVHRAGLREAARARDPEALARLRHGVRAVLWIPLPITSVLTGVAVMAWRGATGGAVLLAFSTALLVYESGYQVVSVNFARGMGHLRVASLLSGRSGGALVGVSQTLCLLLVAWSAPGSGLPGVMLATVVGYALPLVWVWAVLQRSWPQADSSARLFRDLRLVIRRDWKFTFSQSGGFLNSTIELWLAVLVLSPVGASLFAAAQRIGRLLVIPATSLSIVFSPAISRLAADDDRRRLEQLVRTASSVTTLIAAALWLPMVLAPQQVLDLIFPTDFTVAWKALVLIATGYLLNAVSGMSGTTLSMSHHEGDLALMTWAAVAARVVSGVVCAHLAGATGLAASSAVISVLYYAATWTMVRRRLHISTHATVRPRLSLLRRTAG